MTDGTRFSPTIIFKRKTLPKKAKFPGGVLVCAHMNGWMDECGALNWLENTWSQRKGAVFNKPSMLVWDLFKAHLTDEVLEKCHKINVKLAIIPGGLKSTLQPLDVCINKPFKDRLRSKWMEWMAAEDKAVTKGGNVKKWIW
ncbi:unnamed protein product [Larinioides sclopetarius]|uniref:DDE-1 domain-containing protein n=1 Tax=Larinioides sclopetarius TaxID=280406 RepID=A0AAV2BM08_9ARAC